MRGPIVSSNRSMMERAECSVVLEEVLERFGRKVLPDGYSAIAMDVYVDCLRSMIGPRQLRPFPRFSPSGSRRAARAGVTKSWVNASAEIPPKTA